MFTRFLEGKRRKENLEKRSNKTLIEECAKKPFYLLSVLYFERLLISEKSFLLKLPMKINFHALLVYLLLDAFSQN